MQTVKKQMTSNSDNTDEFAQDQQVAYNVNPKNDEYTHDGYTGEELKMIEETKKIFNDKEISISARCVRVGVIALWWEMLSKVFMAFVMQSKVCLLKNTMNL